MASNNVHPQGVPRFARLDAVGALVEEALDVRLYVLLHSGPDLAGEVALGALPAGLARHSVVAGHVTQAGCASFVQHVHRLKKIWRG